MRADVPFDIGTLDHVVLRVTDLDRALAFYRDVLGCAVERRVDDLGLVQLRAGSALIDLADAAGELGRAGGPPPGRDGHNMEHLCLRIDPFDPDALASYLRDKGIEPGEVVRRYGADGYGPSMYIRDPDGNRVELKGPPEGAEA